VTVGYLDGWEQITLQNVDISDNIIFLRTHTRCHFTAYYNSLRIRHIFWIYL